MKTPRLTDFDPNAKVPELKSSLEAMPTIQKPNHVTTPPPSSDKKPTEVSSQPSPQKLEISKTTNEQQTKGEKFEKFSTYLRPGYKKELKIIALDKDCKDYEVLDE